MTFKSDNCVSDVCVLGCPSAAGSGGKLLPKCPVPSGHQNLPSLGHGFDRNNSGSFKITRRGSSHCGTVG